MGKPAAKLWDRLAARSEHATFYHTRKWHEIGSAHPTPKPGGIVEIVPDPLWARFNDGTDVVVPRVRTSPKLGVFSRHLSSPEGCCGGFLASAPLTGAHLAPLWRLLMKDSFEWRINPLQPTPPPASSEVRADSTVILDLRPGFEAIREGWQREGALIPRNVRRAARMGVSARLATSREDYRAYQHILAESSRRWTAPAICPLEKMWALHLASPDNVQLWIAEREGRMLCGQLFFIHGRHVSIYNKGALEDAFASRAPTFLDYSMIERFAAEGRWWYDMGESGGSESARAYKLKLCRHEADASVHIHYAPVFETARTLAKLLRKLPAKAAAFPA